MLVLKLTLLVKGSPGRHAPQLTHFISAVGITKDITVKQDYFEKDIKNYKQWFLQGLSSPSNTLNNYMNPGYFTLAVTGLKP